jgi:antitoxin StbD
MKQVLTKNTTSVSKFKNNPAESLRSAAGQPFAVLTNNEPSFYVVPPEVYEEVMEIYWQHVNRDELLTRSAEKALAVKVSLQDLPEPTAL